MLITTHHKFTLGASLSCSTHQAINRHYCEHERDTANCPLSGMYQEWDMPITWICLMNEENFYRTQPHMISTIFQSSNISIFLLWHQNSTISLQFLHVSLLMDERFQIYWNVTTNSCNLYRNHALVWLKWHLHEEGMMDSAASGSWGNYWVVSEDVHIIPLFLKQQIFASHMDIQITWCQVTVSHIWTRPSDDY